MSGITLLVEDPKWRTHRGLAARLASAAEAARKAARLKGGFTILLAGDKKLRALNRNFRGKDKPTNVLSFPQAEGKAIARSPMLGDIILAHETIQREADEAGKTFADHVSHLVVHGLLHLFGYDHLNDTEAEAMEALEMRALATLGIDNPYADAPLLREAS